MGSRRSKHGERENHKPFATALAPSVTVLLWQMCNAIMQRATCRERGTSRDKG